MPLWGLIAALMGSVLPKVGSVVAIALISIYSLLPQGDRLATGMSGGLEHIFAYSVTGFLLTLALRGERSPVLAVTALAVLASLLEVLQHWASGRHPGVTDAAVSTAAAALGALLAAWLRDVTLTHAGRDN